MRVDRYTDPLVFAEVVEGFLLEREAEHSLLLGILSDLLQGRDGPYADMDPDLLVTRDGGNVRLVAVRTPPRDLVVSLTASIEAVDGMVDELARSVPQLPGVAAPVDLSRRFIDRWRATTGGPASLKLSMRTFRASRVVLPQGIAGEPRAATPSDRGLFLQWNRAFQKEALHEEPSDEWLEHWADVMLSGKAGRGLSLWQVEGQPVSMAGYGAPTPNGIRVFAVYTPPELRRHGYATACVAALTDDLLSQGRSFCFLSADHANPTSNAIYRRIGYEPVIDVESYALTNTHRRSDAVT